VKEGIFIDPQIPKLSKEEYFDKLIQGE